MQWEMQWQVQIWLSVLVQSAEFGVRVLRVSARLGTDKRHYVHSRRCAAPHDDAHDTIPL